MKGLFIGRFQPFHKGHLEVVKKMHEECDTVIIGVGSAQVERETSDPLSGGERIEMIRRTLKNKINNFEIYPIPDIECYPAWTHYVKAILPPFDRVYASSEIVLKLFKNTRIETVEIEKIQRDKYSGTEIRERIRDGEAWRDLVPEEVAEFLEEIDMKQRLKPVLGMDSETEKWAAHLLTKNDKTISTAESCTGGLIAHRLTNVPGSSSYFMRGMVTYSYKAKRDLLGVDDKLLEEEGAVSDEVAAQMAEGVREKSETDLGLSTTGIAGPGGGTEEKPVGTVHMALATEDKTLTKKKHFSGNRWEVKEQISEEALRWIIDVLED